MYDPYSVLGLGRSASGEEVKQAFRMLAKRFHPDTPEGAADKGRRFKDLSIAYEILSDAKKRKAYDRGEIDAHGNPRAGYKPRPEPEPAAPAEEEAFQSARSYSRTAPPPPPPPPHPKNGANGARTSSENTNSAFRSAFERAFGGSTSQTPKSKKRVDDLFSEFFGDQSSGTKPGSTSKGVDSQYDLFITFEEAALGGTRRVKLPGGKRFDVKIPIGVREGQTIRLKGLGEADPLSGHLGDALITILIEPHPYFVRDGYDIKVDLPVTLNEALQGAKVKVPTLQGPVAMSIPPAANAGQVFRLKGKGIPAHSVHPAGDQLVTLQIVLPDQADQNLSDIVKRWETAHPYDPRKKFGGH